MEQVIKTNKKVLRGLGSNIQKGTILKYTKVAPILREIRVQFPKELKLSKLSRPSDDPSIIKEIKMMLEHLRSNRVFTPTPSRQMRGLKKIPALGFKDVSKAAYMEYVAKMKSKASKVRLFFKDPNQQDEVRDHEGEDQEAEDNEHAVNEGEEDEWEDEEGGNEEEWAQPSDHSDEDDLDDLDDDDVDD